MIKYVWIGKKVQEYFRKSDKVNAGLFLESKITKMILFRVNLG